MYKARHLIENFYCRLRQFRAIADAQARLGNMYHDGRGVPQDTVMVRLQPELAAPLDDWRRKQADLPSRAECIRRLVELGLKAKGKPRD
jgi:TPR repeat protein